MISTRVQAIKQSVKNELMRHLRILATVIVLLWVLEIVDVLFGHRFDVYGIQPRTLVGLRNILFAPFLHSGFLHLLANTIPFFILGWFVMLRSVEQFFYVSIVSALVSGLGVWLFGAPHTVHLGISGVIFGYMGFLLLRGYFEQSPLALLLAVLAFFLYGGMLWGVFPVQPDVSWLGHLFGFAGGGLTAYGLTGRKLNLPVSSWYRINSKQ